MRPSRTLRIWVAAAGGADSATSCGWGAILRFDPFVKRLCGGGMGGRTAALLCGIVHGLEAVKKPGTLPVLVTVAVSGAALDEISRAVDLSNPVAETDEVRILEIGTILAKFNGSVRFQWTEEVGLSGTDISDAAVQAEQGLLDFIKENK